MEKYIYMNGISKTTIQQEISKGYKVVAIDDYLNDIAEPLFSVWFRYYGKAD